MIKWRLSDEKITPDTPAHLRDPKVRANTRCTIFLGYTSNHSSCGLREYIRYLCQHKMIDAVVTTCGGIEEDFMKCMNPFYMGDFHLQGKKLRNQGVNRTGNLLVPMHNYEALQDWMMPILKQMHKEQRENGTVWTPSKLINRLGKEINNEESIYYWCYKNDIPVFSPAITDGEIGDILFDHCYEEGDGFVIDLVQDIKKINDIALRAHKSGMLISGGGLIKHHIANAQIRRGGADFSVYVNTAVEMDGSDAGADPDEAVSWGKIGLKCDPVKVWAEATLVLPILIGETFAKNFDLAKRN
jgi:deoxyhypusine synthase